MNHLDQIGKAIRNQQLLNVIDNAEQSLPNIKLPGLKGDTLSLLPLRNKLVVLDFGLLTTPEGKAYAEEMKAGITELLEQVEKKSHECFMLLNDYVSEKEEPRLDALLDSFGNYSLHSGLHAGVI